MELRQYWRVLVRRRIALRNTVLLVALLSLLSVAYSYYNGQYFGRALVAIQVQQNKIPNSTVDPTSAANQNSVQAVADLTTYASSSAQYFKGVSAELKKRYGLRVDWKTVAQGLRVFANSNKEIFFEWYGSRQRNVQETVQAAVDQLVAYVPIYHDTLYRKSPDITSALLDPPNSRHVSLTKPLADFLLRLALGLVAGIMLAYLLEYVDDTVQDESDVRHWMRLETLAVIPGAQQARRARSA